MQYRVSFSKAGTENSGDLWSDGYNSSDPACVYPMITRCDRCLHYFWIRSDYQNIRNSTPKIISMLPEFPHTRRLNAFELAEVITSHSFNNPGTETYLRKLLWWTINDIYRFNSNLEVETSMKSLFEENLESLIYKNPPQSPENHLQLAEIYRELNQFNQARQCLHLVKSPSLEKFVNQMNLKIDEMDNRVFLLGRTVF